MKRAATIITFRWFLAALTLFGFALRVDNISTQEFSGDEAFTVVNWATSTPLELFTRIAQIDPQPPLALASYAAWLQLAGDSELAARLLAALANTLAIAMTAAFTARLFNNRAALLAALLTTINPFQLAAAQDARHYALWFTLSLLSASLASQLLRKRHAASQSWIAYVVASVASLFTFYLDAFSLVAQNLFASTQFRQNSIGWFARWTASQLLIIAPMALWLTLGGFQNSEYRPTASPPDISNALITLTLGSAYSFPDTTPVILPLALLACLLVLFLRAPKTSTSFLTLQLVVPLTLLAALALLTNQGFFRPRYVGAVSPYIMIIIAAAIDYLPLKKLRRGLSVILLCGLLAAAFTVNINSQFNPQYAKSPSWRQLVDFLAHQTAESDLVMQNYPDPAFAYYYHGAASTVVMPKTANADVMTVSRDLTEATSNIDQIWFVATPNPAWDRHQQVHTWLNANLQPISEQWVGTFHLFQYGQWQPKPTAIRNPTNIEFSTLTRLDGYNIAPNTGRFRPGDQLTLELFLTPANHSTVDLTLFVHLIAVNPNLVLITQDDHPPQHNLITTQTWELGTLLRDVTKLTIPSNTPSGTYYITVGFYNPVDGARIPSTANTQPEPSSALITTITIEAP